MTYSAEIEHSMRMFHDSLSEKDRRRYAAIEAAKLGHGGTEYVATLLGCDPKTIRRGLHRLGYRWKRPQYVLGRPDPAYAEKRGP